MRRIIQASILGFTLMAGCAGEPPSSRARPVHVPRAATFVGGDSGGEWMICEGTAEGVLHCQIFDSLEPSFREAWFRYCPQIGTKEAGHPLALDWERGLRLSEVQLRRDRPDVFHPAPDASAERVQMEQELTDKYYALDGVTKKCIPVAMINR